MRRYVGLAGVAALTMGVALLVPGVGAGADDGGRPFRLELSGAKEFNTAGAPINAHGAADHGTGEIRINYGLGEVCYEFGAITMTAGEPLPKDAHIHRAPEGFGGPIVVPLFSAATAPTAYPTDSTCVEFGDKALLKEIIQHPDRFYVNLHNAPVHAGGVMRDQLRK